MASPIERVLSPRRERRRRSRALLAAARLGVLCLGLIVLWRICLLALSLGPFSVTRVQIVGLKQIPRGAVLQMLGRVDSRNMFRLPVRAIRRRLESHPAVERARLSRRLPGTLRIEIAERPMAAFVRQGGEMRFVDRRGRAFACRDCMAEGLAEIAGVTSDGQPCRSIAGPLAALSALKEARLSCEKIRVAPSCGLEATVAGGVLVKLGLPERLGEKARKARLALAGLSPDKVEYLDVSCPTAIVWKPLDGSDRAGW